MFSSSGCPNQNPDPSVGPWCQGDAEQCFAPSESPSISLMPSSSNMPSSKPSISLMPSITDVGNDCTLCNKWNRPVITAVEGTSFQDLLMSCTTELVPVSCPEYLDYGNVPIGCWDTSDVTDMSSGFSGVDSNYYDDVVIPNV